MQIVRTIVWVLLLVILLLFSINNWTPVQVKIWEDLILETKLPALVIVSFLLGLVPMWLAYLAARWRNARRISALENTVRAATPAPPIATSTQLDAAAAGSGSSATPARVDAPPSDPPVP